jgi:hypothetical protein
MASGLRRASPEVHPESAALLADVGAVLCLRDPISFQAYASDDSSGATPIRLPCGHTFARATLDRVRCLIARLPQFIPPCTAALQRVFVELRYAPYVVLQT